MIRVREGVAGRDKALFGLAISVSFREGENVASEFESIREALGKWQQLRGDACGALEIEYEAPEGIRPEIKEFWVAKVDTDDLIRSVFAKVGEVVIQMITLDGRNITSFGFMFGPPDDPRFTP